MKRDEQGAAAVIVAISLTALFAAAMLAVDAGSLWRTRREAITNTDAGALAAARYIDAQGAHACDPSTQTQAQSEATNIVAQNDPHTTVTGFAITPTNGNCGAQSGHVRLDATLPAPASFSGMFGVTDLHAASTSIAQWGPLTSAIGLRPIGICDKSDPFVAWTNYLAGNQPNWGHLPFQHLGPNGEVINTVQFQNTSFGCGSGAGNWSWLDFNGTIAPNGDSELGSNLLNGYQGVISLADSSTGTVSNCDPEASAPQPDCAPQTGATGNSTISSLTSLLDNSIVFPIIVYDRVVNASDPLQCASMNWTGTGSNARYCHVAFLLVRLWGWNKITGNNGSFDFQFINDWWVGSIGADPSGSLPTTHGVSLCGGGYGTTIDMKCDV
ncbi:MAG: hypothetical protein ACYDCC_07050 [Actinomycetota bacterium]